MTRLFDHRLQLLAGVESDDAARADGNLLARLGIAAGTLGLVPELEVAETGELPGSAAREGPTNHLKIGCDHFFGFAFIEAHFQEKRAGKVAILQIHPGSIKFFLCTDGGPPV